MTAPAPPIRPLTTRPRSQKGAPASAAPAVVDKAATTCVSSQPWIGEPAVNVTQNMRPRIPARRASPQSGCVAHLSA